MHTHALRPTTLISSPPEPQAVQGFVQSQGAFTQAQPGQGDPAAPATVAGRVVYRGEDGQADSRGHPTSSYAWQKGFAGQRTASYNATWATPSPPACPLPGIQAPSAGCTQTAYDPHSQPLSAGFEGGVVTWRLPCEGVRLGLHVTASAMLSCRFCAWRKTRLLRAWPHHGGPGIRSSTCTCRDECRCLPVFHFWSCATCTHATSSRSLCAQPSDEGRAVDAARSKRR